MDLRPGDVLDAKYRIVRLLGQGGMGAVYEAVNVQIDRRVAIKVLHTSMAASETSVQRFEREAKAAARIGSPNIVEALDFGTVSDGIRYLVMEYLEGESLRQRLAAEVALSPMTLLPIVAQILDGLADAHDKGIIHRDLKPDNVILVPDGEGGERVKIVDFGVSKLHTIGKEDEPLTKTGVLVGTPFYMAPEQLKGSRDLDGRADLFSVGLILYRGLSGRLPFPVDTLHDLMFHVVLEDAPALSSLVPEIDPALEAIVATALARNREARYPNATAFRDAVTNWLERRGRYLPAARVRLSLSRSLEAASDEAQASAPAMTLPGPGTEASSAPPPPPPPPPPPALTAVLEDPFAFEDSHDGIGLASGQTLVPTVQPPALAEPAPPPHLATPSFGRNAVITAIALVVGLGVGVIVSQLGASEPSRAASAASFYIGLSSSLIAELAEARADAEEIETEEAVDPPPAESATPSATSATAAPPTTPAKRPTSVPRRPPPDDKRTYRRQL